MTEFNERVVRIQMKDQIDIMKRKKISPSEQYSSGEGEGDSLDPPTIKKPGGTTVTTNNCSVCRSMDERDNVHVIDSNLLLWKLILLSRHLLECMCCACMVVLWWVLSVLAALVRCSTSQQT